MRLSGAFRVALVAVATLSAFNMVTEADASTLALNRQHNVVAFSASMINPSHKTRVLAIAQSSDEDDVDDVDSTPAPKKKKKKKARATPAPSIDDNADQSSSSQDTADTKNVSKKKKKAKKTPAPQPVTDEDDQKALEEELEELQELADEETEAPKKKKKKSKSKSKTTSTSTSSDESESTNSPQVVVQDHRIQGLKNEGVIDHSSEGSAEIDKIDLRNQDGWISVYDDPPLLVIKASLYAFIAYNDSAVCDTFNMTMNAVEQKAEEIGRYSYHVVTYINCTKDGNDETQGRFILNFIPEGKRLLLTECGHREEGEIVNWLRIQEEVPQCMTPDQRKKFLSQPMKHIHVSNGTVADTEATQTNFFTRLEDLDGEEVAIAGSATVALIAVVVVLIVFVLRKRKAQKDLERTIAGAKAEHAVEDDEVETAEEKPVKERKGLMDSAKAKTDDPDMEEGSFVNSPAVRV